MNMPQEKKWPFSFQKMNISKVGHLTSPLIDKKAWEKFNLYKTYLLISGQSLAFLLVHNIFGKEVRPAFQIIYPAISSAKWGGGISQTHRHLSPFAPIWIQELRVVCWWIDTSLLRHTRPGTKYSFRSRPILRSLFQPHVFGKVNGYLDVADRRVKKNRKKSNLNKVKICASKADFRNFQN